jgi:GTP cyclohydrolase I
MFSPVDTEPLDPQEGGSGDREEEEIHEAMQVLDLRTDETKAQKSTGSTKHMGETSVSGVAAASGSLIVDTGKGRPSLEETEERRVERISKAVLEILECLGEDPRREGLQKTPERYARALLWMTKGYHEKLEDIIGTGIFNEDHDEMVIVKEIEIFSLCEHHLVPFTGKLAIGYIPNQRVIGLSKLVRIAEFYARRLQLQERLTKQIAKTLNQVISPKGVAVVIESTHMCMTIRGVQKPGSVTVTSSMLGCFRSMDKTRAEFLNLIKVRHSFLPSFLPTPSSFFFFYILLIISPLLFFPCLQK